MPEEVKKSYEITLRWYLGWCRKRAVGCSVDSARAFVEWAQQEKDANDWLVGQWKAAIRWFFIQGKQQAVSEVDPGDAASKSKLSEPAIRSKQKEIHTVSDEERLVALSEEEARIISLMRRRGMALRTERSYIRWYHDFLQQSDLNSGAQMDAGSLKSYLSYLAMDRAVASSTQNLSSKFL